MSEAQNDPQHLEAGDSLPLSRKEGLRHYAEAPPRTQPEPLTRRELKKLSERAASAYNRQRSEWHANLGPIKTPQLAALHEDLWDIIDSNAQFGDRAKGSVAIDAFPGLGKTTAIHAFLRQYHRREIDELGQLTESGAERWPVCFVGLTGNTGIKEFNRSILEFFAHPGSTRGTAADYSRKALDCVLSCETRVLIVDDLHFLQGRNSSDIAISNHFKYVANEFPVTTVFVGAGLRDLGLFSEGKNYQNAVLAQTGRRTTYLDLEPFMVTDQAGRNQWQQLLRAIEQRVVLADKYSGMLADELSDYLYTRSTGHIGSLMTLINRGCQRAVRSGDEKITARLLNEVKNDVASERARRELEAAINTGKLKVRRKAS